MKKILNLLLLLGVGWIPYSVAQESFDCINQIPQQKFLDFDGSWVHLSQASINSVGSLGAEFIVSPEDMNRDRNINLFSESGLKITNKKIKVKIDYKGSMSEMRLGSGLSGIVVLDGSTLIIESTQLHVAVIGQFNLLNNSRLIIKTDNGLNVNFGLGGDYKIHNNSHLRIFSGGSINVEGSTLFQVGEPFPNVDPRDQSKVKFYASNDVHFKDNTTFSGHGGGHGDIAALDRVIFGELTGAGLLKLKFFLTQSLELNHQVFLLMVLKGIDGKSS